MSTYQAQTQTLEAEILGVIERWHRDGSVLDERSFNDLALRLFAYQVKYDAEYGRYCAAQGVTAPQTWEQIPAVPAQAFKEAALSTFDPARAALVFETSGTSSSAPGRHYMETPALYDAALLAGFDRFMLADGARLRYFNLVPNPKERPQSSLGYMMARVGELRGDRTSWYIRGDELLFDALERDLRATIDEGHPACISATAFALVHLLDAMDARDIRLALPVGSRIMETGGFKGRTRVVARDELHERACNRLGVAQSAVISEYGMTELSSQYYAASHTQAYAAPPWLRTRVVGPQRNTLPNGNIGALLHVDLANRSSCLAVQTEDLGAWSADGLLLIGRDRDAELRGCSLDAEELLRGAAARGR